MFKQSLKLVASLMLGAAIGLLLAIAGIVAFTDMTIAGFMTKSSLLGLAEGLKVCAVSIAAFIVAVPALILVHEGGHLVGGLMSGYRFVSFRILNLTFIRINGRIAVRRFSVAGTGGQCLMCPPDLPPDKVPQALYNLGGVLANTAVLLAVAPLFLTGLSPLAATALSIVCLTDLFMILTNGIPMRIGGISNDALNAIALRHNFTARRAIMTQLRSNAMIQEGVRPKDMPDEWFTVPEEIDYKNALEVSLQLMAASRLIDMERWEQAHLELERIYASRDSLIGIYVKETECELLFTALVTGHTARAEELMADNGLMQYVERYSGVMSSKLRVMFAVRLLAGHDRPGAMAIYDSLEKSRGGYLLQGEVESDLAIMRRMLDAAQRS